jgi:aminoglycoside phosphotransferase (APT) family kinase protein
VAWPARACDLIVAWNLLRAEARDVLRAALPVDEATWARGRGWALSVSLIALPYYRSTNPAIVASATHTLDEVLADQDHINRGGARVLCTFVKRRSKTSRFSPA